MPPMPGGVTPRRAPRRGGACAGAWQRCGDPGGSWWTVGKKRRRHSRAVERGWRRFPQLPPVALDYGGSPASRAEESTKWTAWTMWTRNAKISVHSVQFVHSVHGGEGWQRLGACGPTLPCRHRLTPDARPFMRCNRPLSHPSHPSGPTPASAEHRSIRNSVDYRAVIPW